MQNELNLNTSQGSRKVEQNGDERATTEEANREDNDEMKRIEYLPLDLSSFQSTKECVRLFKERNLPLHILVNNAAVAWMPFSK